MSYQEEISEEQIHIMEEDYFICRVYGDATSYSEGTGFGHCAPCGDGVLHEIERVLERKLSSQEIVEILREKPEGRN